MDSVQSLNELVDPGKIVGFCAVSVLEGRFATSDIDLAAYLRLCGCDLSGTIRREFPSRGRTKVKVFLVFEWAQAEQFVKVWFQGGLNSYRTYITHHRELMGLINDTKDSV